MREKFLASHRKYPSAPIVGVGAVVIHEGRVLLVRRNQEPLMGRWSLPGGAVELGETLEQAVVREVFEETGVTVAPLAHLTTFDRIECDATGRVRFHYVLTDFLCEIDGDVRADAIHPATDVSDAKWVSIDELRGSKEFSLSDWTLKVIEDGSRLKARAAVSTGTD